MRSSSAARGETSTTLPKALRGRYQVMSCISFKLSAFRGGKSRSWVKCQWHITLANIRRLHSGRIEHSGNVVSCISLYSPGCQ